MPSSLGPGTTTHLASPWPDGNTTRTAEWPCRAGSELGRAPKAAVRVE